MKRWLLLSLTMALMLVLAACGGGEEDTDTIDEGEDRGQEETTEESTAETGDTGGTEGTENTDDAVEEVVTLNNNDGEEVATATLTESGNGVSVALVGENLPSGELGFHFHETGACEEPDFESAGGHYNPTDASHGFDHEDGPHAGDMENIEVSEDGTVETDVTADMVTLQEDGENTLYTEDGTALVIHSEADDYESQPSGDAGDRVACGVVGE